MAEKGARARDHGTRMAEQGGERQYGGRTLQRVEHQRCGGEPFVPGAQHIGGADVARADGADVAQAGEARQDEAEGNRAHQEAARQRIGEPVAVAVLDQDLE